MGVLRIAASLGLVAALGVVACAGLPPVPEDAPPALAAEWPLVARRCTRCHTMQRVLNAADKTPDKWRRTVDRMAARPGAGITPEEAGRIARAVESLSR